MSVILVGPNGQVALAAPGRPMLARPLAGSSDDGGPPSPPPPSPPPPSPPPPSPPPPPVPVSDLSAIAGLAGWWDAAVATNMMDANGAPLAGFGAEVAGIADLSGHGAGLTVWHQAA